MREATVKDIDLSNNLAYGKNNNPFPGLRPFKIEESHLFFGREGQSDEVLLKLSQHRFVGIIGPSGSGKSSFIYCGVLPILYGGFLTGKSTNWEVVVTRPGAAPIENLAESLLATDLANTETSEEDIKIKKTIITSLLKSSSRGLVETIMQFRRDSNKNYLILVDQFEELFRFKDSSSINSINDTLAFINLLMEAINYEGAPIYVAITMRSDFIGECSQFPELTKKINDSQYLIPQMTRDQKRRAITGPVAVGDAEIAPRLVQQLLNDLGDNPDQLPILQHALMRTWDYWTHYKDFAEEPLDIKHYEAIGTMAEALSMHANEAFDELDDEQKRVCEFLFKAITEKRGGNFGIRRPTKLAEIAAIAATTEAELVTIIDKFRDPSRSLLTPQYGIALDSHSIIDISHESIMRIWNRLKNWVNDEEDAKAMYQRLAEAAEMYQEGKTGLWRPPDLQLAINWQDKHKPTLVWGKRYHPAYERTMAFLQHSEEEFEIEQRSKEIQQKRRLRTARITALIMGGAVVICILFLVYAFVQQTEAKRQALRAQEFGNKALLASDSAKVQAKIALEQKSKAEEASKLAEERRQQAILASDSAKLQAKIAQRQREKAELAEGKASEAAIAARAAEREAKKQEEIALEKEQEATKLRYLAIANAISVKATQLNDPQLKALLAQQAYIFNQRYDTYDYNPEIYDGLFYALKEFNHPLTQKLKGHEKAAKVVVAGKDESEFFSAGSLGSIIRWTKQGENWSADSLAGQRSRKVIKSMIYDDESRTLYATGQLLDDKGNTLLEKYDLNKPKIAKEEIRGLSGSFVKMRIHKDNLFILDEAGKSLKVINGNKISLVYQSTNKINDFDYDPAKEGFWLGQNNGALTFFSIGENKDTVYFQNTKPISAIEYFEPFIAIGDISGGLKLFSGLNFKDYNELNGHIGGIDDISLSNDGAFMLSASKDKTVRVWNLSEITKQPIILSDHSNWVWSAAFGKQGKNIYTADEDGYISVWPFSIDVLGSQLCQELDRNLTRTEWATYIGADLDYEATCSELTSE